MIIGKSLTALGGGGLKPEITVTAKAGALLNLHYKDSSIILQSYQLGAEETQHTFTVNVSETAYVVEDVTNSESVEVLVDAVAMYNVEIEYKLYLYRDGEEFEEVTGGWVGVKDSDAKGTITKKETVLYFNNTSGFTSSNSLGVCTVNEIILSGYTKIIVKLAQNTSAYSTQVQLLNKIGVSFANHPLSIEINIAESFGTNLSGRLAIKNNNSGTIEVSKVWLE